MPRPYALITGGTSGIGFATAKKLVKRMDLALVYRSDAAKAEKARAELQKECTEAKIQTFEAVLDGFESCSRLYSTVKDIFGAPPETFIHSSGRMKTSFFLASSFPDEAETIKEHLVAPLSLTHLIAPDMYALRKGRIVLLSSVAAHSPLPGQAVYAAAKGALESFAKALSLEVFHRGITVNCVAPGMIDTPTTQNLIAALKKKDPSYTPGKADDVASIIAFLCSDETKNLSGQTVLFETARK